MVFAPLNPSYEAAAVQRKRERHCKQQRKYNGGDGAQLRQATRELFEIVEEKMGRGGEYTAARTMD